jgi:cell division protein FtsQ
MYQMKKTGIVLIGILLVIAILIGYLSTFHLTNIQVEGCDLVSEQDVRDAIDNSGFMNNTIVLYIKNKIKPIDGIPFVAKLDIDFVSKNTVDVTVYEKTIAGCIEYMNSYVYFDKDGIIMESSDQQKESVPCIQGLDFASWEMGEKLPIQDEEKFKHILTITQLIEKYELSIDGIEFTDEDEIVLHHEGISIELGEGDYLAVQMMNLGSILEGLEGLEGTLYMKDFDSDHATASFKTN